jgi:hypothetical protein
MRGTGDTTAVPRSPGQTRPLCPACIGGRLQAYEVQINLEMWHGYLAARGYTAVCVAPDEEEGQFLNEPPTDGCGFSMNLEPIGP